MDYFSPDNIFDHSEKGCIYFISATHHFLRSISGKFLKDIKIRFFFAKSWFILPFLVKTTEDWKKTLTKQVSIGF